MQSPICWIFVVAGIIVFASSGLTRFLEVPSIVHGIVVLSIISGVITAFDAPARQSLLAFQYLPSGKVMFSGNQTTLDMRYPSTNVCLSSQMIASLDDIAFNNNQSECTSLLIVADNQVSTDVAIISK